MKRMYWAALCALALGAQAAPALQRHHQKDALVYYSGEVVVSGQYLQDSSDELLGDTLCFTPDKATAGLIPREKGDTRSAWFCFDPQTKARSMLKLPAKPAKGQCGFKGTATLRIGHYVVNTEQSDVYDTAQLLQVVSSGKPQPVACPQ
ncbi:hypothetical protein [Leeia aquatica]|uniref:Uncharacterized protein n=1 Tax=Leeia aquatica TaxID=2725557 RepID=A0A847RTG1_9NEIS|nr:hypothetical protein [Leeia aquatica]NLR74490.1 hypothetical protein [Leeia aquatica]